jgi:hypothetical protein
MASFSFQTRYGRGWTSRIGVNHKAVTLPVVFDSLQVIKPVPIVPKDLLALIAPDNHVANAPSNSTRVCLAMRAKISEGWANKAILRPNPIPSSLISTVILAALKPAFLEMLKIA